MDVTTKSGASETFLKMPPIMGKGPNIMGTIEVEPDQFVRAGQVLANVETSKGNRPIKAGANARLLKILCHEGDEVKAGQDLFLLEEVSEDEMEPPKPLSADLFIIGGGPGGYVTALYAAKRGLSVVLAEEKKLGGTCLNCGCIPTKALIQSAHIWQTIKDSQSFGITVGDAGFDAEAIFQRKTEICDQLRTGVEGLLEGNRVTVVRGHASFTGPDSAVVKEGSRETEVHFRDGVIATGSAPVVPAAMGPMPDTVMDSEQALNAGHFEDSVVIIGGGVIGMEFAFLYRSMGVRVCVVEFLDHILGNTDPDVSGLILERAEAEGIRVYTGSRVTAVTRTDSGETLVTFEQEGAQHTLVAQAVLTAMGRRPVTEDLGLEAAGVALTERGFIQIDDHMKTSAGHIYAIGDVTGKLALAHTASHQGMAAVDVILGGDRTVSYGCIPSVIFTRPEVACVGRTEQECREAGIPVTVSKFPFAANGKAKIMGEETGFVKLIRHSESRVILGGAIVGPDASALISTVTTAVRTGMTDLELSEVVFAHPTTSEAIHEAVLGLGVGMLHYQA